MTFCEALHIEKGITAIIGGGGKTSLMYQLARELSENASVIVTTSTHILPPEHIPFVERLESYSGLICVGSKQENGKLASPLQSFDELAMIADYVLVEADGSKHLPLKAHLEHEPVIPAHTNQVIAVVGLTGANQEICEVAHRWERYRELAQGDIADSAAIAKVLNTEALHDRVLLNQADTQDAIDVGREIAQLLKKPTVIAALQRGVVICSY